MSRATGAVKFPNGKIMFYEYNGTVDIALPHLYETYDDLHAHWRRRDRISCTCSSEEQLKNHTRVEIASTYGYGFSWNGFACTKCLCLLSPLDINEDTYRTGLPDWFPNRELYL